jgi:hypothetical protein
MESKRSGDALREQMLAGVLVFVRAVAPIAGVRRIALVGSIMTAKPTPKDVDLLVTVTDDADLALLARCAPTTARSPSRAESLGRCVPGR